MSKINNHQLIMRACTSLASATLCATIFLAINTSNVKASPMPLPVQSNVAKNVNQTNHVIPDNNLLNSRHIMPKNGVLDNWQNVDYSYDESTKTLTIKGGTLVDPNPIYKQFANKANEIQTIKITGKLTLEGNANSLFFALYNLKEINGANNIDTCQVTDMSNMFGSCTFLDNLDVSNWDTSHVTNMSSTFSACQKLSKIDVSNWNTSKVTKMNDMFALCDVLDNLDVSNWNTSKVTEMSAMFESCYKLSKIDVSNWDTNQVTDMSNMFASCTVLDNLDVSNWNTSKVTDMAWMFYDCSALDSLDVSKWVTSNVTDMSFMFKDCQELSKINVSNWNTSQVTDMYQMFDNCYALDNLDVSNWNTSQVTDMRYMFAGLSNLVELCLGPNINIAESGLNTPVEWVSVGKGTINKPAGTEYYSSNDLSKFWNDKNYSETWVRSVRYSVKINYIDLDDNDKVIQSDSISGNSIHPIDYKSNFDKTVTDLKDKHYEYVASSDKLPWSNGQIQLPEDVTDNTTYTVGFKHATSNVKDGDKNPVTGDRIGGLSKTVTQTIKYTGAPSEITDNVQKITFTRNATVDLVTGKVSYLDWDNKELSFKDVDSPKVAGYVPDITTVKGATVKPTDSDVTKEVKYSRGSYNITINYIDSNDNDKVIKTDKVSGNPDKVISYQDQLKQILHDLPGYVIDKNKTTLPLDSNNDIKLPDSVTGDKDYQVVLKHDSKTMHAGDKNPVTGKNEDGLTKTITQTIKYTGAPNSIADNVQKVVFERDADVDMVTGKLTYHDWNNKELSFKDVDSPKVAGYVPDIASVKGATVKPTDSDVTKEVKYSRGSYNIKIDYVDSNTGKVVKTDKVSGNPDKIISYQDQLKQILHGLPGYVIDKDKTTLPLDDNNDIKLPDSVTGDKDYQVVLNHDSKTMHAGDKNPVTGKDEDGLTKTVTQTIKYTGAPSSIADNMQKVTFKRSADVDMVTGKLTYHDWDNKELPFKDVVSPAVTGYDANPSSVKGATVTPDSSDITKTVTYVRSNYGIKINYVDGDDNNNILKTDAIEGNPETPIAYKGKMTSIINSLTGYILNKTRTDLPLNENGDIQLPPDVLGSKTYNVVLNHKTAAMKPGDKNPVTGKDEDGLTKTITRTIKYTGSPTTISDKVQKVTFTRNATVDLVTGELTYLAWDKDSQTLAEVVSPKVAGYVADPEIIKAQSVKPSDSDITKEVKYSRGSYNIKIDYVDSNTGKVVKTDKVSGNPDKVISYQDQLKEILHDLSGCVIDKDKTTLPLDDNNDIKLPADVTNDKDYQVVLKHDSKTIHAGDKNPVTGKDEDGLTKTITQTIKYTGAPSSIADNVQKFTFKRDADVDMVTGKLTYHDWDNKELSFKDVTSPSVDGYDADIAVVKGTTVKPTDSDITKTVTYTKKEAPSYDITINYTDDTNKVVRTDKQKGKAGTTIQYHDKLQEIINQIGNGKYEIDKDKSNLPLDNNNDIKLPDNLTTDHDYYVVLKHKIVTIKHGDKNPVTGELITGLTKDVKQVIKYTGTNKDIPDNVQTAKFTRNGKVDLVTGKVEYLDWNEKEQSFKDVASPTVSGYTPDITIVKGVAVTAGNSDIVKQVTYTKNKQDDTNKNDPDYEITIDYQDENGKTIKTDKQKGKANSTIPYKDRMQEIINSIVKNGYEVDWSKSNLPVDSDGNIKLGAITGNTNYKLVLKHKSVTFKHGEKNPFTGKEDPNLERKVTQTIKYLHSGKDLPNSVQELTFTRDAQVDMITGKVKYLAWHEKEQTFKDITSPAVNGYKPDLATVKGRTVTGDSKDIIQLVTYNNANVVQTGLDLIESKKTTILETILATFAGILTYFGILKKKNKEK